MTPEEKIKQLEALLADDSEDSLGQFMLGKMYLDVDRPEEAAAALEKAFAIDPSYSAAYRHCGDAYRKSGDHEKAKDVYRRGIAVAEENGDLQTVKEMQAFLKKLEG